MKNVKKIVGALALSGLAFALSSCATTKSASSDPGFNANGSNDLVGLNPYESNSTYGGNGYQEPYSNQNNDYVSVTPTAPPAHTSNPQMPAYQQAAPPMPSYQQPAYAPYSSSPPVAAAPPAMEQTHVVQSGETLYRISRMYASTVEGIKSANRLNSDLIRPGDVLAIP